MTAGRPNKPKTYHKKSICVSFSKRLLDRIDEVMPKMFKSRSEFIESLVESSLFSDKAYASYMMRQAQLEASYWEWEFKKSDNRNKIIISAKEMELKNYLRD